jgi:hypothetical protein
VIFDILVLNLLQFAVIVIIMLFSSPLILFLTSPLIASTFANQLPLSTTDATTSPEFHRITRRLRNTTVTVTSPCRSPLSLCLHYCDDSLQAGNTIDDDCAQDCEDDLCEFGRVRKNVDHEGKTLTFAKFAYLAREAKKEELGVVPEDCLDGCKTLWDVSQRVPGKPNPGPTIAILAANLACVAVCAIFG